PPSYASSGTAGGYGGNSAFTAFQPRSVAASQPYRANNPVVSAPPTATAGYENYYQQQPQTYQSGPSYYGQAQYNDAAYGPSAHYSTDQSRYGMRGRNYGRNDSGLDPETEAQIAQWQSAYVNTEEMQAAAAPGKVPGRREGPAPGLGANVPSSGA